jgi:hypothetical protein
MSKHETRTSGDLSEIPPSERRGRSQSGRPPVMGEIGFIGLVTLHSIKLEIVSVGPVTLSQIAVGGSPVLKCNCWNMARKRFGGVLWCSKFLSRRAICQMGDICDLPSSPEGTIKIDEICRDLRIAVGKVVFALQQLGLCRGDV